MSEGFPFEDRHQGATFDSDREYRYRLWRVFNARDPAVAFIMLNPSTADETALDNTCRRCRGYAEDWGFGELIVGNIFALRATNPTELYDHPDPVGPENDSALRRIAEDAALVVAAWGHHGELHGRGREVAAKLAEWGINLHALGTTQDGHPVHPLYQRGDAEPEPFSYDRGDDA